MSESLKSVGAITLFVEDPQRSKAFYEKVFEVPVLFEDEDSVAFQFENTIINLLATPAAHELIAPRTVGGPDVGARARSSRSGSRTRTRSSRSCRTAASSCSTARSTGRGGCARPRSRILTATSGRSRSSSPGTEPTGTMTAMHRVGLIVPSSNTTMETEVPALLRARERVRPEDTFSFHSARLRMEDVTPEALRAMNEQTERATAELADLRPDVVATACLVAIMAQGPGSHRAAEAEIESILERGACTGTRRLVRGRARRRAARARRAAGSGSSRPYLESSRGSSSRTSRTRESRSRDAISLEVPENRAVAALDPHDLEQHWRRLDLRGCDALVLSACVQMRSLDVLEEVERRSELPTVSAATATTWAILRALDLEPIAPGAGALLRAAPERVV